MSCPVDGGPTRPERAVFCCLQPAPPKRISPHNATDANRPYQSGPRTGALRGTCRGALLYPDHRRKRVSSPKGPLFCTEGEIKVRCSGGFLHAACTDARLRKLAFASSRRSPIRARGANSDSTRRRRVFVRVADHVSKMRPFAAQFTLHRHNIPIQCTEKFSKNASHHSSRPRPPFPTHHAH